MKYPRSIPLTCLLVLAGTGAVSAQAPPPDTLRSDQEGVLVRGHITDLTTQRPLPSVSIRLVDRDGEGRIAWAGMSDSVGVFQGPRLTPSTYEVEVEALGYSTMSHTIALSGYGAVDLAIELAPSALELDPLIVVTRRRSKLEASGFYDRRERGFGHSLTRDEIQARQPAFVSDLFRTMAGVSVSPRTLGGGGLIRMRGGCVPDVILDGVRLSGPVRLDDLLGVADVEGLEVYSGSTSPPQYSRSTCGTVLAWSRDPGTADGKPWSWKRAGAAAGFLLLGFLLTG
ncbi:MAG: TonB-dependent receptor plug domain-containing protein [Gemmatimonadota bacterium]